ncbi:MAG: hypothetical protein U0838_15475 [Chloroflexota bacterium]
MLVESVPNISEGRRLDVVERLADALTSVPGVYLLDRTSDGSHNRSVFTVAGDHEAVTAGLERLLATAIDEIDMDEQLGEHPRIGAVDVVPFVPLGDTTLDDCIELARSFGSRMAARYDLPVYLYASAAARADRRRADVRRGQYEGLKVEIAQNAASRTSAPRMHLAGRRDGRRRPAVPDRLEHQPIPRTWSSPSASPAAIRRRAAAPPGQRLPRRGARARPSGARPGLDDLLDFRVTPSGARGKQSRSWRRRTA